MKLIFFDTHPYERVAFEAANAEHGHELTYVESRLTEETAKLASGFAAVCAFVNDRLSRETLIELKAVGVRLIALRSAGFNHVDLKAADELGLLVTRVPEYSPYAVAEHAAAMVLALNRKIHRAYARVHELNFSLDGLVGFDLHGKTVGIVGTGRIGRVAAKIFHGFGCRILAQDLAPSADLIVDLGVSYVSLDRLLEQSDIITLHVPLTSETKHLIDERAFARMKSSAYLINTSRGGLVDTRALIRALKARRIAAAGLDVYEEEESIFFRDLSDDVLTDDTLARLLTFPNVLVTSHQAFLTREALAAIAGVTLQSVADFENGRELKNLLRGGKAK